MPEWNEYKQIARDRGCMALELFVVWSWPGDNPALLQQILPDHLAYQRRLEDSGHLVFAGPLSDETGEKMQGAGMIIYRAQSMKQARELAEADPMHQHGARSFEMRKWLVNEGALNVSVGLSTGRVEIS